MKVVAEGVEDAETVGELRRIGCDTAQGYLYSRPVRAEQFEAEGPTTLADEAAAFDRTLEQEQAEAPPPAG